MKRFAIVAAVAVVLVAGLYFFVKPASQTSNQKQQKTFYLIVKDKHLVSGDSTLKVTQGDTVVLNATVDEDEELHLHGYDKALELKKNVMGTLEFTADKTGHFEFELEHSGTELGAVEVSPK